MASCLPVPRADAASQDPGPQPRLGRWCRDGDADAACAPGGPPRRDDHTRSIAPAGAVVRGPRLLRSLSPGAAWIPSISRASARIAPMRARLRRAAARFAARRTGRVPGPDAATNRPFTRSATAHVVDRIDSAPGQRRTTRFDSDGRPLSVDRRRARLRSAPPEGRTGRRLRRDGARIARLARNGIEPDSGYFVVSPGASFGSSPVWPAGHFATACDAISRRHSLTAVLAPGPGEAAGSSDFGRRGTARTIGLVDDRPRELFEFLAVVDHDVALVDRDESLFGPGAQLLVDAFARGSDEIPPLFL